MRRLLLLLLVLIGLALPAQAAVRIHGGVIRHARATSDRISADLSYRRGRWSDSNLRIAIRRDGQLLLSAPAGRFARRGCAVSGLNTVFENPLTIRDLDGDGEPEVLLDLYTGGAHCCFYTEIFRFDGRTYRGTAVLWGDPGFELADLDGDGRPELVSADDRFAYEFTSFAGSALPGRIWHYDHGAIREVTSSYPAYVRAEAADLWRSYPGDRRDHSDVRGTLAAWLADEYVLGRSVEAWTQLQGFERRGDLTSPAADASAWAVDRFWPDGRAYLAKLRRFLVSTGYANAARAVRRPG